MLRNPYYTLLEFTLLCLVLPTYIWVTNSGYMMFGFLWAATIYCAIVWWRITRAPSSYGLTKGSDQSTRDPAIKSQDDGLRIWTTIKTEWNWSAVTWQNMKPVLIRWLLATAFIFVFTWFYEPDRFLYVPLNIPQILPFLILLYPVLSALPQEFIFCSFFMKRYGPYIDALSSQRKLGYRQSLQEIPDQVRDDNQSCWLQIIASAIVFGYAHMLFLNWVAPVLSFFGGLVFAYTYVKTRSLALVTLEHSLYGNSIFIAGIGYYFYSGGIGQ